MTTVTKERKQEAEARLKELIQPGDTIYWVVRSVAPSGMSRRIDFYLIKDSHLLFLTTSIADLLGYRYSIDDWRCKKGMLVRGCGMDMIFSVVYDLSMSLFCPEKYDHDKAYSLKSEQI